MVVRCGIPNQGLTSDIYREEVERGLKKIKNGKATDPDSIPIEVLKF